MNTAQKALIDLLSASIHKNEVDLSYINELDWNEVYEEAAAHAVLPLIFPTVKKISSSYNINGELINKWTNNTIMNAVCQTQHINHMKTVFTAFNEAGIQVVALKGLILRELYPKPEFRTMSDSDLLVKKDQLEAAENLLTTLGYSKHSSIGYESCFIHASALPIDLHWSLSNEEHLKNVSPFEDTLWKNIRLFNFHGIEISALSREYEFIHLFVHIASHMIKSGFGLRQLCDIVLFIKSEGDYLDWNLVYGLGEACNLTKLTTTILTLCNDLFKLETPEVFSNYYVGIDRHSITLITDIFESGVHGKRDNLRISSTRMLNQSLQDYKNINKLKLILRYLFPSPSRLDKRYYYAYKYPVLLVIAWIHRLCYELLFNSITRIPEIFNINSTTSSVKNKFELLEWLQL